MADKKLTELSAITNSSITPEDLLYLVDDPGGSPASKKIILKNLLAYQFPLDIPPDSPHASDDEFNGTSLDAKWTNPLTSTRTLTLSVGGGWLRFEPSEAGTGSTASRGAWGIRQNAPAGSFSVSARILLLRPYNGNGDDARCGVFVAHSTATAVAHICEMQTASNVPIEAINAPYAEGADWGSYAGWVIAGGAAIGPFPGQWYKIVWDAATSILHFLASTNGHEWFEFTTHTAQSQPDRMGLCMYSNGADLRADRAMKVAWFRVTEP